MSQKQLVEWTEKLTDEVLDEAERRDLGEANNFVEAVARVRVILRLAEAYDEAPADERPDNANAQALGTLPRVVEMVKTLRNLDIGNPSFHNERTQVLNQIQSDWTTWRNDIRPHIREAVDLTQRTTEVDRVAKECQVLLLQLDEAVRSATALDEDAAKRLDQLQVLTGQAGAGKLAKHYGDQAERHETAAWRFLFGAAAAAAALLFAGWLLFTSVPTGDKVNLNTLLPDLIIRVFTLGVLGYGVSFCAKGYRANKHLQYSNEHRRNALETYILFREGAYSETVQDIVTTELVRAVFSAEETGFLDKVGDKTIIEEQASLLGVLRGSR